MGYTTYFDGSISVEPPLNSHERNYLNKFAETRRMNRNKGPYYVDGSGDFGQGQDEDIVEYNSPPRGQPGLWCQWVPTPDGTAIVWNGIEKFYNSAEWMSYIIDHFLKPNAVTSNSNDPQFTDFTFDHVLNGEIFAQGEEPHDMWKLQVVNNEVEHVYATITYPEN